MRVGLISKVVGTGVVARGGSMADPTFSIVLFASIRFKVVRDHLFRYVAAWFSRLSMRAVPIGLDSKVTRGGHSISKYFADHPSADLDFPLLEVVRGRAFLVYRLQVHLFRGSGIVSLLTGSTPAPI